MFSAHILTNLLNQWSYLAVFAFVAIESTGIPFPGETMLVTAALYASQTHHVQIQWVVAGAAAGAIMGDNAGYILGRTGGRALLGRYGRYIHVDESKLRRAEEYFARHGDKTVFLGRFVSILRTWVAFLAGMNRMHWAKFFLFNALGGILWSALYGTLAFKLGENFNKVRGAFGIGILAVVLLTALILVILHRKGVIVLFRRHRSDERKDTTKTLESTSPPRSAE